MSRPFQKVSTMLCFLLVSTYSTVIRQQCPRLATSSNGTIVRGVSRYQISIATVDSLDDINFARVRPSACLSKRPECRPETAGTVRHVNYVGNEESMGPCFLASQTNRSATCRISRIKHAGMVNSPGRDRRVANQTSADGCSLIDVLRPAICRITSSEEIELVKERRARKGVSKGV